MLDELSLTAAMADVGYDRRKSYVYRAEWSTLDVEHFVYFQTYGTPKDYLAADFGIRNKEAESFAIRSIQAYAGDLYRLLRHDDGSDCFMRFSLGRLASWGIRSSLNISEMSERALAEKIKHDIRQQLFPIILEVTDLARLLSLLLVDAEPHPWIRSNGAMRAAMIVNLARRLGMQPGEVRAVLKPHNKRIATSLLKAPNPDPASYVERIIEDAVSNSCPNLN
jgi:hypothetical protein